MDPKALDILGLSLNLIGTLTGAFSGRLYLKLLDTSIEALETTIQTYFNPQMPGVPLFHGFDVHRAAALQTRRYGVYAGLGLVVLGFALRIVAKFLS